MKYDKPIMQITEFNDWDVIRTSLTTDVGDGSGWTDVAP